MLVTPVTPSAEINRAIMPHFSAIVKTPPLRDQAPDITARCRVGDDANNVRSNTHSVLCPVHKGSPSVGTS